MTITRKEFLFGGLASVAATALACTDDGGPRATLSETLGDGDPGDGDGDPGDGDPGDGDPGDGDPGDGDPGDGDPGDGDPGDGDPGDGDPGDGDPGDGDGDAGDGDGDPELVCPNGASGTIQGNHGHVMMVPQADVMAGVDKDYNIQGQANHIHTVTLTAADFQQLALGNPVNKVSSSNQAHTHQVFIGCL